MDHLDDSTASGDQGASHGHSALSFSSAHSAIGAKNLQNKIGQQLKHIPKYEQNRVYDMIGHYVEATGDHGMEHVGDSQLREFHHKLSSLAEAGHISHTTVDHAFRALRSLAR